MSKEVQNIQSNIVGNTTAGTYTVELFNDKGECIHKERKHNLVHPKLNALYNDLATRQAFTNKEFSMQDLGLANQFGTIQLLNCPTLDDPINYLSVMPEFTSRPAYCSTYETYAGDSTTRGTLNAKESYSETYIDEQGVPYAKKHMVFDFPTHCANGTFNSIIIKGDSSVTTPYISGFAPSYYFGANNSYQFNNGPRRNLFHPNFDTAVGDKIDHVTGQWQNNGGSNPGYYATRMVKGSGNPDLNDSELSHFIVGESTKCPNDRVIVSVKHSDQMQIIKKTRINGFPHEAEWGQPNTYMTGAICGKNVYFWCTTSSTHNKPLFDNKVFKFDFDSGSYRGTIDIQLPSTNLYDTSSSYSNKLRANDINQQGISNGELILVPFYYGWAIYNSDFQLIKELPTNKVLEDWSSVNSSSKSTILVTMRPYYDGGAKIHKFMMVISQSIQHEKFDSVNNWPQGLLDINTGTITKYNIKSNVYGNSPEALRRKMIHTTNYSYPYCYINEVRGEVLMVGDYELGVLTLIPWFSLAKLSEPVEKTSATTMKITYDILAPFVAPYDHATCALPALK